jgi:hypothetical protein
MLGCTDQVLEGMFEVASEVTPVSGIKLQAMQYLW